MEIKPANANSEVIWSTSDSAIATIDEDGKATFLKVGNCTITATSKEDEKIKGSIDIEIINHEIYKYADKYVIDECIYTKTKENLDMANLESMGREMFVAINGYESPFGFTIIESVEYKEDSKTVLSIDSSFSHIMEKMKKRYFVYSEDSFLNEIILVDNEENIYLCQVDKNVINNIYKLKAWIFNSNIVKNVPSFLSSEESYNTKAKVEDFLKAIPDLKNADDMAKTIEYLPDNYAFEGSGNFMFYYNINDEVYISITWEMGVSDGKIYGYLEFSLCQYKDGNFQGFCYGLDMIETFLQEHSKDSIVIDELEFLSLCDFEEESYLEMMKVVKTQETFSKVYQTKKKEIIKELVDMLVNTTKVLNETKTDYNEYISYIIASDESEVEIIIYDNNFVKINEQYYELSYSSSDLEKINKEIEEDTLLGYSFKKLFGNNKEIQFTIDGEVLSCDIFSFDDIYFEETSDSIYIHSSGISLTANGIIIEVANLLYFEYEDKIYKINKTSGNWNSIGYSEGNKCIAISYNDENQIKIFCEKGD